MSDSVSDSPVFTSPITADPSGAAGAVTVTDMSHLSKLIVKTTAAHAAGSGPPFGTSATAGEALVCATRPDEWMVIGTTEATAAAVTDVAAYVVDLTHGRLLIEVAGEAATSALEKVCSIDWSDDMMPDGAVTSASVAKVSCDIIRHDREHPAYWIAADRSFGQYLYEALIDAAAEFAH